MYRASFISFDKDIIKSINSAIFNCAWRGKDKIKTMALISEYEDGGLKVARSGFLSNDTVQL